MRVVSLVHDTPTGPSLHPYQILSNYLKQYGSYSLHKILAVRGVNYITKKVRVVYCTRLAYWSSSSFLRNTTKICLRVSKLWSLQGCVYNFCFWGDNYIMNKVKVLSCTRHTYWSSSSSLPNIISQRVWELWPAQDFGFRGDNYITKIVRVVSLACSTPSGPSPYSYQILSNYL